MEDGDRSINSGRPDWSVGTHGDRASRDTTGASVCDQRLHAVAVPLIHDRLRIDGRSQPRQSSAIHANRAVAEFYLVSARIVYSRIGRWLGPAVPGLGPEARTDMPVDHESLARELLEHALTNWSPDADERRDLEEECERRIDMTRRWTADPLDITRVLDRDALPAHWMTRGGRET